MDANLPAGLVSLQARAAELAAAILAPNAERVDQDAQWPATGMRALADAGLLGLHVPRHLGGLGEGLLALSVITEELGKACGSTSMCYGMHCVATQVIAAKATADQEERYLRPIAEGRHISSLALSEPASGVFLYLPRATFEHAGESFLLNGEKAFITSGAEADSYVVSAVAHGDEHDPSTFTCVLVDKGSEGLHWGKPWNGFGMRGNSSRSARLDNVRVPATNLLGREGDHIWYVFEVIAPFFLVAMAGTYIGIAQSALDEAIASLKGRRFAHAAEPLADNPVLAHDVAEMWLRVSRARQLTHHAANLGDARSPEAVQALFAAKIEAADAAVEVTRIAMTVAGGRAYQDGDPLQRAVRDAQAAPVMSPTTHLLKTWLGRTALGLPPL